MTEKLRLGPLPRSEMVRLTVTLPAAVKVDLDRYAELFGAAHREVVDAAALVPHMLAAFMDRDRAFRRARQVGNELVGSSASTKAAISSTSEAAGDSSSG